VKTGGMFAACGVAQFKLTQPKVKSPFVHVVLVLLDCFHEFYMQDIFQQEVVLLFGVSEFLRHI